MVWEMVTASHLSQNSHLEIAPSEATPTSLSWSYTWEAFKIPT